MTDQGGGRGFDVTGVLRTAAAVVDAELERLLSPAVSGFHAAVTEAVLYSIRAGGKRLRPALVLLSARACGGDDPPGVPARVAAAAVEMVHTYSLIHDDLPAMDNDDFRRGKPTNHKVFGEAMAILAGDALLNHAFTVPAEEVADPVTAIALVRELARPAGGAGMIGGQAADILSERGRWDRADTGFPSAARPHTDKPPRLALLEAIHRNKTAALFRASLRMGAVSVGAPATVIDLAGRCGEELGLAFQVVDDLLDETSDAATLGKSVGKDRAAGKLTYPGLVGHDAARQAAERHTRAALDALDEWSRLIMGEGPASPRSEARLTQGSDLGRVRQAFGDLAGLAHYNLHRTS